MFALQTAARRGNVVLRNLCDMQKRTTVRAGMPRNRIPIAEKFSIGIAMAIGVCAVPAWILSHLNDYKSRD